MKLSDYVIKYLSDVGIKHVFLITGAAVINLVDSFRKVEGIEYVCTQHEQAAAMAAEAYSRMTKNLGAALATSGPGATNLITGICCAYFDSIPAIYITGQVNTYESKGNRDVRQVGFQETDIVSIVKPITKLAVLVDQPEKIKYYLDQAVYEAKSGRPGPVLLDIPMDVQRAEIDPEKLESFVPKKSNKDLAGLENKIKEVLKLIKEAKRPIVLLGAGIKLANAEEEVKSFIERLGVPFTMSWAAIDLFSHDHPLFVGSFGVSASRGGNFSVQNSDLLISIGSRLDTRQTGGKPQTFAREAKKVIVDIAESEINKGRGLNADIAIIADAKEFLISANKQLENFTKPEVAAWITKTQEWKNKYPICLPEYKDQKEKVNIYYFMEILSQESAPDDVIITDAGGNLTWTMQGFKVKEGQKLFSAFNNSPMGYSMPASIGASFALGKKPITCIIGDGGIQMNIQDLQTIFYHKLPIKIFVIDNNSYGIIKQFQDIWLNSEYEATCPEKGCSFPDFVKVGQAYGLKTETISNHGELQEKIRKVLASKEAVLCNVRINDDEKISPKLEFGKPIEDAAPVLERKEFLENMIIKPIDE